MSSTDLLRDVFRLDRLVDENHRTHLRGIQFHLPLCSYLSTRYLVQIPQDVSRSLSFTVLFFSLSSHLILFVISSERKRLDTFDTFDISDISPSIQISILQRGGDVALACWISDDHISRSSNVLDIRTSSVNSKSDVLDRKLQEFRLCRWYPPSYGRQGKLSLGQLASVPW